MARLIRKGMYRNLLFVILTVPLYLHCRNESMPSDAAVTSSTGNQAPKNATLGVAPGIPKTTRPVNSLAEFFSARTEDFSISKPDATLVKNYQISDTAFLIPRKFNVQFASRIVQKSDRMPWPRTFYQLKFRDLAIEKIVLSNVSLLEYIRFFYPDAGIRRKFEFLNEVRKLTKPLPGYYVDANYMGDRVLSLILDNGQHTVLYQASLRQFHSSVDGTCNLSIDELKKILFSVELVGSKP